MAKGFQINSEITGPRATTCSHCGGAMEEIGLCAPKCSQCGQFDLSHLTFGPPVEVEVDIKIEEA